MLTNFSSFTIFASKPLVSCNFQLCTKPNLWWQLINTLMKGKNPQLALKKLKSTASKAIDINFPAPDIPSLAWWPFRETLSEKPYFSPPNSIPSCIYHNEGCSTQGCFCRSKGGRASFLMAPVLSPVLTVSHLVLSFDIEYSCCLLGHVDCCQSGDMVLVRVSCGQQWPTYQYEVEFKFSCVYFLNCIWLRSLNV